MQWIKINPKSITQPQGRSYFASGVDKENIWIQGGWNQINCLSDLYFFNILEEKWIKIDTIGTAPEREGNTGILANNSIYVFGGHSGYGRTQTLFQLNLETKKWQELKPKGKIPLNREYHSCSYWDGKIWIFGGWGQGATRYNDLYSYDIEENQFEKIKTSGKKPRELWSLSSVVIDNKLIIFGGEDAQRIRFRDIYSFDFQSKVWTQIKPEGSDLPSPRSSYGITFLCDSLFAIFGGTDQSDSWMNDLWIFNLKTCIWTNVIPNNPKEEWPKQRQGCSLHFFNNSNDLYLFGGYDGNSRLNDLYKIRIDELIPDSDIIQDFDQLFQNQENCDITFNTSNNKQIQAHSQILQIRLGKIAFANLELVLKIHTYEESYDFLRFLYSSLLPPNKSKVEQILNELNCSELLESPRNQLLKALDSMYHENSTKDFKIIAKNGTVSAHQCVLMARSDLFRGMLISVNDDSKQVKDYSGRSCESIKILINFFYTNKIQSNITKEIISDLGDAKDFYGLNTLSKFDVLLKKKV
ncbi:hypothetical protein M0811_09959 [Anaeramoeba ignava]|uniref:BTB domain-containing protein n=1 Tax=Anaeramoeba ignava TaxID=1746090 RepID=A0A9Q0R979_ANAIG|nr:hypothetical protein M0811_09959 [Anaeramoeba ignava]